MRVMVPAALRSYTRDLQHGLAADDFVAVVLALSGG